MSRKEKVGKGLAKSAKRQECIRRDCMDDGTRSRKDISAFRTTTGDCVAGDGGRTCDGGGGRRWRWSGGGRWNLEVGNWAKRRRKR